jgi:hypothetical protein
MLNPPGNPMTVAFFDWDGRCRDRDTDLALHIRK